MVVFGVLTRTSPAQNITEYTLPSGGTSPQSIAYGPGNFYWMAGFSVDQIISINPTNGITTAYGTPTHPSHPFGLVTVGTNVWFTENFANQIGVLVTTTNAGIVNHTILEFPIHTNNNANIPCGPAGLTLGPDHNLWFVEAQTNKIGSFNLATHKTTEYFVPFTQNNRQYYNIMTGPDGNLWFTDTAAGKICVFSIANTNFAVMSLATNSQPFDIIVGPDYALWFSEYNLSKIGRLTTNWLTPGAFSTSLNYSTYTNVTDSNIFTEITVPTNNNNSVSLTNAQPYGLTVVTNGTSTNIWFTEYSGSAIDKITAIATTNTTNYVLTRFPTPTFSANPTFLASGADVNIWFGELAINAVGRLVLDHSLILTETNISLIGTNFSGILATFTDNPTNNFATNYSAIVSWGDGSTNKLNANSPPTNSSLNIITNASGGFKVNASHKYLGFGTFPVNLTITDNGNSFNAGGATGTGAFSITTMPVPPLSIIPATAGKVVLSWTNNATNVLLQLQVNTNSSITAWKNVTNTPVKGANGQYRVTNNVSGRAFYRLKAQ